MRDATGDSRAEVGSKGRPRIVSQRRKEETRDTDGAEKGAASRSPLLVRVGYVADSAHATTGTCDTKVATVNQCSFGAEHLTLKRVHTSQFVRFLGVVMTGNRLRAVSFFVRRGRLGARWRLGGFGTPVPRFVPDEG